jgi:two-component system chemotaxis sensor kinase CheA
MQPVIVFSEGTKSMGLMVSGIQDIIEDKLVIRIQSRQPGIIGTAIINERATDIIDIQHYIHKANPDWFTRQVERASARILVIDDSMFFRQLESTALEAEGYRVMAVESAVRAVEVIEEGRDFDLIVCDIDMPMMDGFEFAEWMREDSRGASIPMIALTSLSTSKNVERGLQAGFNSYLKKFDVNEFLSTVKEYAEQVNLAGANG